jgi:MraZ protein
MGEAPPFWGELDGAAGPTPCRTSVGERWGKQVELFLSTYVNKVDRKGRVSVPATFRSTLANNRYPNLLIAFPSIRLPAIECTGSDRMEEMQERIETLEQFSDEHENLSLLFAEAQPLAIDGEGRVIVPEVLKEHAHIGGEVAFVGLGANFQLWDPAAYAEHRAMVRERAARQGTTLPPRGRQVS